MMRIAAIHLTVFMIWFWIIGMVNLRTIQQDPRLTRILASMYLYMNKSCLCDINHACQISIVHEEDKLGYR